MSFPVDDGSNSTGVTTSGDHAQISGLELDRVHDLVCVDVQSDHVVNLWQKCHLLFLVLVDAVSTKINKFG